MRKAPWLCFVLSLAMTSSVAAQSQPVPGPFTCSMSASERTQENACYIIAQRKIDHFAA